jgi:dihydrofolate reductase
LSIKIALVAGIAQNGVIGFEGAMPWRLSTDLKRFKSLTMGKPVIMGRKTFESIGRPLPGRLNVVVSRSGYTAQGIESAGSLNEAIAKSKHWALEHEAEEICVIGGGDMYSQSLPFADRLYITHILAEPVGDTKFPKIDEEHWCVLSREVIPMGEKDSAETIFVIYERNRVDSDALGH